MNSRFYVTAVVALLLAAAYNGGAKRPAQMPAAASGQPANVEAAQPSAPVTARTSPPSQQASLPRS
jgi:hypothetical protein